MIGNNNKGTLIVISGPSGAGKDTICQQLLKEIPNLWLSISVTTREMRIGEVEGIHYFFKNKDEFEKMITNNEFLEYATVHSNQYYGTPKKEISEKLNNGIDVILEIDINGALQIKENFEEAVFIFILPPSMEELKNRLIKRGTESKEKIMERFQTAYKELNYISKYNYVVINDQVEDATNKIKSIIMAEKCRVDRIKDVFLNNLEENIHETIIGPEKFINEEIKF